MIKQSGHLTLGSNSAPGIVQGDGTTFSITNGVGSATPAGLIVDTAWTPVDASGAGLSLTVNSAYYSYNPLTKVVTVQADITYPLTIADTSDTAIGGLPFAASRKTPGNILCGQTLVVGGRILAAASAIQVMGAGLVVIANNQLTAATLNISFSYIAS